MKLDTAEKILEWADWLDGSPQDTATAKRLAYCVRVTEIMEREADDAGGEGLTVGKVSDLILDEAAQKEDK